MAHRPAQPVKARVGAAGSRGGRDPSGRGLDRRARVV